MSIDDSSIVETELCRVV